MKDVLKSWTNGFGCLDMFAKNITYGQFHPTLASSCTGKGRIIDIIADTYKQAI